MIVITLTRSDDEIIFGIPEWIEIETSTPATIFYTLDGLTPTETSLIYTERLFLPSTSSSLTFKAYAIAGLDSSAVLTEIYSRDLFVNNRNREPNDGLTILDSDGIYEESLAVTVDGDPAKKSAFPFQDLEMRGSEHTRLGFPLNISTTLSFIKFQLDPANAPRPAAISDVNQWDFNPQAHVIKMSSMTNADINDQKVRIINRPHSSMYDPKHKNDRYLRDHNVTSSLVTYKINPVTGVKVSYYYDRFDNRWIISKTQVEPISENYSPVTNNRSSPFVFKWIEKRNLSLLF